MVLAGWAVLSKSDDKAKREQIGIERRQHAEHLKNNSLFKEFYTDREKAIIDELYGLRVNYFTRRQRDALLLEYQSVRALRERVEQAARLPKERSNKGSIV